MARPDGCRCPGGTRFATELNLVLPFCLQGYRAANRHALWHGLTANNALAGRFLTAAAAAALWGRRDARAGAAARRMAAAARNRTAQECARYPCLRLILVEWESALLANRAGCKR